MNFFEEKRKNQAKTKNLIFLYFFLSLILASATGLSLSFFLELHKTFETSYDQSILIMTVITLIIIYVSSLIHWYRLNSSGGIKIAESMGGIQIAPLNASGEEKKLLNIIEEMSIASRFPIPAVFILPDSDAINAFAAGITHHDAVIGVTKGSLEKLNRDELQAVIAHEYGHLLSGDMKLNMKLLSLMFGFEFLSHLGRNLSRGGRSRRNQGGGIGLILIVAGVIGVFVAKLLQAAISRTREFDADASSVQFTRNPQALASALKKISTDSQKLQVLHQSEMKHFFFVDNLKSYFFSWHATHPPLKERIKKLIRGDYPLPEQPLVHDREQSAKMSSVSPLISSLSSEDPINTDLPPLSNVSKIALQFKPKSPEAINYLKKIKDLIEEDQKITLDEFLIYTHLKARLMPKREVILHFESLQSVAQERALIENLFKEERSKIDVKKLNQSFQKISKLKLADQYQWLREIHLKFKSQQHFQATFDLICAHFSIWAQEFET